MIRQRKRSGDARLAATEQAMRDEEVLRATRELAAYFKGRRTEREARAALKIIKAFVRGRERLDAKARPPLPGFAAPSPKPKKRRRTRPASENQTIDEKAGIEPEV
jgi:hypothetical protein